MRAARALASPPGGAFIGTNVPYTLSQSAIPFIHISSGTIGNNGALTAITALPLTYSGGAYCYYPANSIAAATAAGWYWTVFSSTTAGTIYNSTYTSGTPVMGTQTAFATTGPGAFTGDITERAGPTITLPAGVLGTNGRFTVDSVFMMTNSAGAKTFNGHLSGVGGTLFLNRAATTIIAVQDRRSVINTGAANSQRVDNVSNGASYASSGAAVTTLAIDTSTSQTIVLTATKAVATDNAIYDSYCIEVRYAA